ncbi:hypothetical protein E3N88_20389 [Mikania micrantha]|uniref:Uncharacterized protein n=1 Tax=Mikania micrantha TaxID=192012 RepID=A0A5N6NGU6_9ASTR|nr:hypothetical protein E3N88_20389 [Mikania micrantha]
MMQKVTRADEGARIEGASRIIGVDLNVNSFSLLNIAVELGAVALMAILMRVVGPIVATMVASDGFFTKSQTMNIGFNLKSYDSAERQGLKSILLRRTKKGRATDLALPPRIRENSEKLKRSLNEEDLAEYIKVGRYGDEGENELDVIDTCVF